MIDPRFFPTPEPTTLAALLARIKALHPRFAGAVSADAGGAPVLTGVNTLDAAGASELTFFDNPKYLAAVGATRAGACLLRAGDAGQLPAGCVPVLSDDPYRDFAYALQVLYPERLPDDDFEHRGGAYIHRSAQVGEGTHLAPGVYIGPGVRIGRDSRIGPGSSIMYAYVGDRVVLHPGVRIGQDGFGFAPGRHGHVRVPQLGRVIVQDDVDIGAGTAIDRGALGDTVIGEGSKLDNLLQIGHNVKIGRLCLLAGNSSIAGSVRIGDGVMIGGHTCIAGHLSIGDGARLSGGAGLMHDMPAGAIWSGTPARSLKRAFREYAMLSRLAAAKPERS